MHELMTQRALKSSPLEQGLTFLTGVLIFFINICFGTYFLQSSLIILQNFGLYAHWAAILIVLPAITGLIQHVLNTPARLPVALLGAILSTAVLYPYYSEKFWASPPTLTDTIVFAFAVGGIGFSFSINPLDRHVHSRRTKRSRKMAVKQNDPHLEIEPESQKTSDNILNSSIIKSLELLLTILSFILAIWGTFFLGSASSN